ncbi:Shufflon-specific DNA recombinase (fragment) [Candidatus Methylobacter favarea]|uniref:Shufflon-specific DNA recombinase n=2 Tax=Candidatus Methylobacter favarea TaxID=2707345 RepID=A0A8S0WIG6_9GAMM
MFTIAIKEWGFPLPNPVTMIRKLKAARSRDRRLAVGDEQKILDGCNPEMQAFVILAIETAMRRGELHGLKRSGIKGRLAYLPDTKNGTCHAVIYPCAGGYC